MASSNNRYSEGSYTTVACNSRIQGREKFEEILNCVNTPELQFAQGVDRRDTADNFACNKRFALALYRIAPDLHVKRQTFARFLKIMK